MKYTSILAFGVVLAAMGACSSSEGDDDPNQQPDASSGGPTGDGSVSSSGAPCAPEPEPDPSCNTAVCTQQVGAPAVCRAGQCVALALGDDCKQADFLGKYDDENAIFLGSMMAMVAGDGRINPSGPPRRNSIELAIDEINAAGGVPAFDTVCGKSRPLAAVVCDDGGGRNAAGTTDVTERIGHHLVDALGIHAIIGPGTSAPVANLVEKVMLPAKALLIAPSATAISITNLPGATVEGQRLVWRTAPSDLFQSQALIKLLDRVVTELPSGTTKLAIVSKSDAYGKGLGDAVEQGGRINGAGITAATNADHYARASYEPTATDAEAQYQAAVDALVALQPTVIVLAGTGEAASKILVPYEATNPAVKPFYVLPDGPAKKELWDAVAAIDGLRTRIRGTVPGVVTPLAQNFFDFSYKSKYPTQPDADGAPGPSQLNFGMAGSYDATYLLTYALVATQTAESRDYDGLRLSRGIAQTVSGPLVDVGPANFNTAVSSLAAGTSIDFNGASSPLDFDLSIGEAPSDMIVWCVRKNPNQDTFERFDSTGQTYSVGSGQLEGDFACPAE